MYKSSFSSVINKYVAISLRINDDFILYCAPDKSLKVMYFLKNHTITRFRSLLDIAVTDFIDYFEVNYCLVSTTFSRRFRLKTIVWDTHKGQCQTIKTLSHMFESSSWLEREAWDMFGIYFDDHRDLRRILTDYGFNGHPLRKSFPLSGYVEVRYSSIKKRVVLEPIELPQEARVFDFSSPWV